MVRAIMIVEMMGRPAEHLTKKLEEHVGKLRKVKDLTVHSIVVSEPKVVENEKKGEKSDSLEMWTAFAECDFECESFGRLSETMFDFMPSSIEVVEPGEVRLDCVEATDLLNNISGRLHRYDDIAKIIGQHYKKLEKQMEMAKKIVEKKDAEIAKLKRG